jgi:hypothetical protein
MSPIQTPFVAPRFSGYSARGYANLGADLGDRPIRWQM